MGTLVTLELEDPWWHDFVASRPEATPFHHPAWARLLADCYGFSAFALALTGDDGAISVGAPVLEVSRFGRRTWSSLPFTDSLGLLTSPASGASIPEFVELADQLRRRNGIRSLGFRTGLGTVGSTTQVGVTHELALTADTEELWRGFDKSRVRSEIRRSEREGVSVEVRDGADGMRTFYELHLRTRQRQGVPVQPRRFFGLLLSRMIDGGLGHVLVAEVHGRPAAAAILLAWNRRVIYKLAASDRDLLGCKPNHALVWEAIRSSAVSGNEAFDFGRSDLSNIGLRAFKSGWGAVESPLAYTGLGSTGGRDGEGVGQRALAAVIQRSPPVVCRVLGEKLYRYAA